MKWPDDFPDEAQRGKTKTVRVTLAGREAQVAAGARRRVRARGRRLRLARRATRRGAQGPRGRTRTREADADVRQQLIDEIVQANPFDVPPSWVNQLVDGYMQAYQIPEEERERFAPSSGRWPSGRCAATSSSTRIASASSSRRRKRTSTTRRRGRGEARRRPGPGVRVAPEGRTPAGNRAGHHGREGVQVVAGANTVNRSSVIGARCVATRLSPSTYHHHLAPRRHSNGNDLSAVRHRALQPRRAHLRHLLAAAHGPHHLPRHADQRRRREHHHRAAAVPRRRQSGARHPSVHQLAGRQRLGRPGDLRHDAVPEVAGEHDLHGPRGEHGRVPAGGGTQGKARSRFRTRAS